MHISDRSLLCSKSHSFKFANTRTSFNKLAILNYLGQNGSHCCKVYFSAKLSILHEICRIVLLTIKSKELKTNIT